MQAKDIDWDQCVGNEAAPLPGLSPDVYVSK